MFDGGCKNAQIANLLKNIKKLKRLH